MSSSSDNLSENLSNSETLSFKEKMEQAFSPRKLDLESKRAQFFGYQINSNEKQEDEKQENDLSKENNKPLKFKMVMATGDSDDQNKDTRNTLSQDNEEDKIFPQKVSRQLTLPDEFGFIDAIPAPVGFESQDEEITPKSINNVESLSANYFRTETPKDEGQCIEEEQIVAEVEDRKREDISFLLQNVHNAQKFISITRAAAFRKKSNNLPDDQISQDSDISDDEQNFEASFTPGQDSIGNADDLETNSDIDNDACDSGNVTLISHQSIQNVPDEFEDDFEKDSIENNHVPPLVDFNESETKHVSFANGFVQEDKSKLEIPNTNIVPVKSSENENIPPPEEFSKLNESTPRKHVSFLSNVAEIIPPVRADNKSSTLQTAQPYARRPNTYAMLSAPKGWGQKRDYSIDESIIPSSEYRSEEQCFSPENLPENQAIFSYGDSAPVLTPANENTNVPHRETLKSHSLLDFSVKPTGDDEYRPMERCYSPVDLPGNQVIVTNENNPPILTPDNERFPYYIYEAENTSVSNNKDTVDSDYVISSSNSLEQKQVASPPQQKPKVQKHLATSADVQRALAVAESVNEPKFLGEKSDLNSDYIENEKSTEDSCGFGQSFEPEHLELERRSLIKQMRVKRKKVNKWSGAVENNEEQSADRNVNRSLKMFEERKKKEKDKFEPDEKKFVPAPAPPVAEKKIIIQANRGEVDKSSLSDVKSITKQVWEEKLQQQEITKPQSSWKPGKIWDMEVQDEAVDNKIVYSYLENDVQNIKMGEGNIQYEENMSYKKQLEDSPSTVVVAPPSGFGDQVEESAMDREIRLALEREQEMKKETEMAHKELKQELQEDQFDNDESIIEREIRYQQERENAWRQEGNVKDVRVDKELIVHGEVEKEEDTAGESIIEREIRLQLEKETAVEQERLRLLNLEEEIMPTNSEEMESTPVSYDNNYTEISVASSPPPPTHRQGSIQEISGYSHRGESLIARELREAREREEEYKKIQEEMMHKTGENSKQNMEEMPKTPAVRPSSIVRIPSTEKPSSSMSSSSSGYRSYQSPASTPRSEQSVGFTVQTPVNEAGVFKRTNSQDSLLSSASSTNSNTNQGDITPKVETQQRRVPKVRPLEDEPSDKPITTSRKETPIEREIRLTREREEEYRRSRGLPDKQSGNDEVVLVQVDYTSPYHSQKSEGDDMMKKLATSAVQKDIEENKRREVAHRHNSGSLDQPDYVKSQYPIVSPMQAKQIFSSPNERPVPAPRRTSLDRQKSEENVAAARYPSDQKPQHREMVISEKMTSDLSQLSSKEDVMPVKSTTPSKPVERQGSINRPLTNEEREGLRKGQKFVMRQSSFKAESRIQQEIEELRKREDELKKRRDMLESEISEIKPRQETVTTTTSVSNGSQDTAQSPVNPNKPANTFVRGQDRVKRRSLLAERWQKNIEERPDED